MSDLTEQSTSDSNSNDRKMYPANADELMDSYQDYIHEIHRRFPHTYGKLNDFIDRGNCRCPKEPRKQPCKCSKDESYCSCPERSQCICHAGKEVCKCKPEPEPCKCINDGHFCTCEYSTCHCRWKDAQPCDFKPIHPMVRIYNIFPKERQYKNFLKVEQYDAGDKAMFEDLKKKFYEDWKENQSGGNPSGGTEDVDDSDLEDDSDHMRKPCRLITVEHLSANVAKLLGGVYDVPADFFNRHLPGTEALSGRLISRLPSSVQIDFDELYESSKSFSDVWPNHDILDGHKFIQDTMDQKFLFRDAGWDYFPVSEHDWKSSLDNKRLSRGFEVLTNDGLKNVFQFNLTHRISIFSQPPRHPTTAIILFYPRLFICKERTHYPSECDKSCGHNVKGNGPCSYVNFRGIPDTVPTMSSMTKLPDSKSIEGTETPTGNFPDAQYKRLGDTGYKKQYAAAFDREFRMHLWDHLVRQIEKERKENECKENERKAQEPLHPRKHSSAAKLRSHVGKAKGTKRDRLATFVHLFGVPLFRTVASNWARLVVRRSFDLDLLEWRPLKDIIPKTVEEIKSRRVAIARHQRDISASLEVLRGLTQEERAQRIEEKHEKVTSHMSLNNRIEALTLALHETNVDWNRGRSNGFVTDSAALDSWERLFYDFFELKASMDALEKRADKIQDGMLGLMTNDILQKQEISKKQSDLLNLIALIASVIVVPFSVVGTIFSIEFTNGGPSKHWWNFLVAMLITMFAAMIGYGILFYRNADEDMAPKWLMKWKKNDHKKKKHWFADGRVAAQKTSSEADQMC